MLAEVTDVLTSGWAGIIGQLGVVAALVWYLWYRTSVADPKRDAESWSRIDQLTQRHDDTIRETVDKFDKSLLAERTARREDLVILRASLKCQATEQK